MADTKPEIPEVLLDSQTVFTGRVLTLTLDKVRLEDGAEASREVIHHRGAVCIAALTAAGDVLMVRQYRHPVGAFLWELPAGKLEAGEVPLPAALRELGEETGYTAEKIVPLGDYISAPGYSGEVIHLYAATGLAPVDAHPDDDEFITCHTMPLNVLCEKCLSGEIADGKTLAGALRLRRAVELGLV